jgi:chromosome segregation ATPase
MRLCEVRGCTAAAVGLVTIKAPSWRVAESRRVCARHHRELAPPAQTETEDKMGKVKCGTVGPCSMCGERKRIKARAMCERCYELDRKRRKAEAEVAKVAGTSAVPQGPEKSRAEMEKLREQLALAVQLGRDHQLAHQAATKWVGELKEELAQARAAARDHQLAHQAAEERVTELLAERAMEVKAWATTLDELDELVTPEEVERLSGAELRIMLTRWNDSRDQLRAAATAALEQDLERADERIEALEEKLDKATLATEFSADEAHELREDVAVATTLLVMARDELEGVEARSGRIVSIMVTEAIKALEGER